MSFHEKSYGISDLDDLLEDHGGEIDAAVKRFALYCLNATKKRGELDREELIKELERIIEMWAITVEEPSSKESA